MFLNSQECLSDSIYDPFVMLHTGFIVEVFLHEEGFGVGGGGYHAAPAGL